jgi:hypothetical protein
MAYTLPVFNVPVDVWSTGHVPSVDAPDFENVATQPYIYSRVSFDVHQCELELYLPALQLRQPLSAIVAWQAGQVFEVPAESGRYYRARIKERVHMGFSNEYLVIFVVQCNADGVPVLRDIEGAEPCGGPTPGEHDATGVGPIEGEILSNASAERIPSGGMHNATGTGSIEGDVEGIGEANRSSTFHQATGEANIEGTVAGEGEAENIV